MNRYYQEQPRLFELLENFHKDILGASKTLREPTKSSEETSKSYERIESSWLRG